MAMRFLANIRTTSICRLASCITFEATTWRSFCDGTNSRRRRRFCISIFSRGCWLRWVRCFFTICGCAQRLRGTTACFRRRGRTTRKHSSERHEPRLPGLRRAFTARRSGGRRRPACFTRLQECAENSRLSFDAHLGGTQDDSERWLDADRSLSVGTDGRLLVRHTHADGAMPVDPQTRVLPEGGGARSCGLASCEYRGARGAAGGGGDFFASRNASRRSGGGGGKDALGVRAVCGAGAFQSWLAGGALHRHSECDERIHVGAADVCSTVRDDRGRGVWSCGEQVVGDAGAGAFHSGADAVAGVCVELEGGAGAEDSDSGVGLRAGVSRGGWVASIFCEARRRGGWSSWW